MAMLKDHELAALFPLMTDEEIDILAEDIKANGLREKIVLLDGKILDGRNRYRACKIAKAEPEFKLYKGTDPLRFVVSLNLHRRHLTESQRGLVAGNIANMDRTDTLNKGPHSSTFSRSANLQNGKHKAENVVPVTQAEAAELLNVSTRTVADAKKVIDDAEPEIVKAVETGRLPVSTAAKVSELPQETQREIAASDSPKKAARKAISEAERDPVEKVLDTIQGIIRLTDSAKREIEEAADTQPLFKKFVQVKSLIAHYSTARKALHESKDAARAHA